jgi:hypothetical protein
VPGDLAPVDEHADPAAGTPVDPEDGHAGHSSTCASTWGPTTPATSSSRPCCAASASSGHEAVDHGPPAYDAQDDYPPYVLRAAQATADEPGSLGVVIGGSGNGEAIAANKVRGVRCALAWSLETAQLGRQHNDANVVGIGRGCTTRPARSRWSRRSCDAVQR